MDLYHEIRQKKRSAATRAGADPSSRIPDVKNTYQIAAKDYEDLVTEYIAELNISGGEE